MANTKNYVGRQITIQPGTKVRTRGGVETQQRESTVTIYAQEPARNGKTRVFWKRYGYGANTLIA